MLDEKKQQQKRNFATNCNKIRLGWSTKLLKLKTEIKTKLIIAKNMN